MKFRMVLLILMICSVFGGCIWFDDDHGPYISGGDLEETVVYINETGKIVDNYIDDEFVGSVGSKATLHVYSLNLDGHHEFTSISQDGSLTWGPTYFTLRDGEVFRIYLEETGMSTSQDK